MSYFEDDEKFGPKSDDEDDDDSTAQSDLDEEDDDEEVVDNDADNEVEEVLGEDLEEDDETEEDLDKQADKKTVSSSRQFIPHSEVIVQNKYKKSTNSIGVEDIQKLPLDWFQNVRQDYKKNKIIPRKKEIVIRDEIFRDQKKKI